MGSFYILSAIFLWSSLGVFVKISGAPVHLLIFYSALVSVIIQGLIFISREYRAALPFERRTFYLLILGPLSLVNTATFFFAFKNTTIANAILTHYIAPVVVAFLAPLFLREPLTKRILISIAIASVGLWIMLGIKPGELLAVWREPGRETLGMMSGLFSGFAYALIVISGRALARNFNPLALCFLQNLTICLILMPFVRAFPADALWILLFMGVVHSTLAPILYFKGLSEVPAGRAAILGYVEPVSAIILGVLFLGEHPASGSLAGGAMILFSGYLTLKAPPR